MVRESEILLYTTPDGAVRIDVLYQDENIWLTQKRMAELFGVQIPAINNHLKNIFESAELTEKSVISILERTAADGKSYAMQFYNLDAIIAVGYRVNSKEATQFRIWATKTLKEFIIKGFVLDSTELQASRHQLMRMQDWIAKLDAFLSFNEFNLLEHAGKISAEVAKAIAEDAFDRYRIIQDQLHESDFDKLVGDSKARTSESAGLL